MSGQDYEVVIRVGQASVPGKMVRGSVRGALIETDMEISGELLSVSFGSVNWARWAWRPSGRRWLCRSEAASVGREVALFHLQMWSGSLKQP